MNVISLLDQPNNTMKFPLGLILVAALFNGCSKKDSLVSTVNPQITELATSDFTLYRILRGNHYCDVSVFKVVSLKEQNFKVKFDSSAFYKTITEDNQFDINKLFGFSEGMDPHKNSARIGWSFNKDSLRLYGYVYNNAVLATQEITTCKIGDIISCSIKTDKKNYTFIVDDKSVTLERGVTSELAEGYQLYPYFGGDETAPHNISIFISLMPGR